ncbi:MAG: hypothetical protein HQL48_10170 [Gammaproteobacteria bacterium]|nr:hypothetical protein [Gammaproteobacteria bacterium]
MSTQPEQRLSLRGLAAETGVSKSEVSLSIKRSLFSGLLRKQRTTGQLAVVTSALLEFSVHGLRYVFPAQPLSLVRGIATGVTAPVFQQQLYSAGEMIPVWADAHGTSQGLEIKPLFPSVPFAVRQDRHLYAFLALLDSLRIGQVREQKIAAQRLTQQLENTPD